MVTTTILKIMQNLVLTSSVAGDIWKSRQLAFGGRGKSKDNSEDK